MHRGPPRPVPSSEAAIVSTSIPASSQARVGPRIALVGDDDSGRQRQGVVAVVPLFSFGDNGIAPRVDDA